MTQELVPVADPVQGSLGHLLAISFLKSTSPSYQVAVDIARGAATYHEGTVGRQLGHVVIFGRSRDDAVRAQTVLQHLQGLKSLQVFAGGKLAQNVWKVRQVLDCYLDATACRDYTAHCHRVIDDPFERASRRYGLSLTIRISEDDDENQQPSPVDRYLFPCSYLLARFRFELDHPAKATDLVQAGSVKEGCDWCPLFEADSFKKIGTTLTVKGKSIFMPEG